MGVPRQDLPQWDSIQFVTAQLARRPLLDDVEVGRSVTIGPNAVKPLKLEIPLFVSDMSFGALSEEAKVALAKGAELAGTGICSGEGGMLPDEQEANSRYFYELASGRFGWALGESGCRAGLPLQAGPGGQDGHRWSSTGAKVVGRIAEVRGLPEGQSAVSPPTFPNLDGEDDFAKLAEEVRQTSGGIPIG